MAYPVSVIPPQWVLDRIDKQLAYDPEIGWIIWVIAPLRGRRRPAESGDRAGTLCDKGRYRRLTFWRPPKERIYVFEHNIAFYLHEGRWPPLSVDHKDRDGTNNKWDNLRLATTRQQQINTLLSAQNTSGFKGIHWLARQKRWWALIRIPGRKSQLSLGYFDTPEEAAEAYRVAALKYHDRDFLPQEEVAG